MLQPHLHRLLTEFIAEIEAERWFGKEREIVSRFALSKLVKNVGCCEVFHSVEQIGVEVRVAQVPQGSKKEVCKDMVIWKFPNQTVHPCKRERSVH